MFSLLARQVEQFAVSYLAKRRATAGLVSSFNAPEPTHRAVAFSDFASRPRWDSELVRVAIPRDHREEIRAHLEHLGHPTVQMLDGGFKAWTAAGGPVSTEPVAPATSDWHGSPDPSSIATWKDVLDRLGSPGTVIVDTRSGGEHDGTTVRARRGGAIPGAVHREWKNSLDAQGRFKSKEELRAMFEAPTVAGLTERMAREVGDETLEEIAQTLQAVSQLSDSEVEALLSQEQLTGLQDSQDLQDA